MSGTITDDCVKGCDYGILYQGRSSVCKPVASYSLPHSLCLVQNGSSPWLNCRVRYVFWCCLTCNNSFVCGGGLSFRCHDTFHPLLSFSICFLHLPILLRRLFPILQPQRQPANLHSICHLFIHSCSVSPSPPTFPHFLCVTHSSSSGLKIHRCEWTFLLYVCRVKGSISGRERERKRMSLLLFVDSLLHMFQVCS